MHRDILLSYVILHHCKKDTQLTMHLFVYYNIQKNDDGKSSHIQSTNGGIVGMASHSIR